MTTSCPNTFHDAEHGLCVFCHAPRTVCRHCGIDVGPSGADGGSWVPYPHRCVARPQGASTGPLSARMRPNSEAAPWVIEDVKRLEAEHARLTAERDAAVERAEVSEAHFAVLGQQFGVPKDAVWSPLDRVCELQAENARLAQELAENEGVIAVWRGRTERAEAQVTVLTEERDTARANYQFMVNRAADEKLDGYRELGARAAHAENTVGRLRARLDCEDAAGVRHCRHDAPCLTCARRTLASLTAELRELSKKGTRG